MLRTWHLALCAVWLHVVLSDDDGQPQTQKSFVGASEITHQHKQAEQRSLDSHAAAEESYEDEAADMFEEKHAPHNIPGIIYALLTPVIGALMVMFAFPILYFNERRGTKPAHRHEEAHVNDPEKPDPAKEGYKEVGQTGGGVAASEAPAEGEHKELKHHHTASELKGKAEEKLDEKVHAFEQKVCSCFCCKAVDKCCDKIPERGNIGYQTWAIRFLGFFMIWFGMNMFLYPLYFIMHLLPIVGAIMAASLAACVCKFACCGCVSTICTGYSIHRPLYLALFIVFCIGLLALNIYMMGAPEHHHHVHAEGGHAMDH